MFPHAGDREFYRDHIARDWMHSPYYAEAESWLDVFWSYEGPFRAYFDQLDLTEVVELACGQGRHAAKVVNHAGSLTLVDVNETNISVCRERFSGQKNVR